MTVIERDKKAAAAKAAKGKPAKDKPAKGRAVADGDTALAASAVQSGRDVLVPLDRLVLSENNVRKVVSEQSLVELAALIESQGLLQRLCVVALPDERFAVVAGGRRLRAMQLLVQEGRWSASQPVECKVFRIEQALQVSLAENSGFEVMHPADQMEGYRRLIETEGLTVAQVAGRFGVTPLTVERRLKLAHLAPRFLDMYRADEIEAEQLQALALTDDRAAQEAIWDGMPAYDRSAWRIRDAITAKACSADSKLARFVGLDAYEAAGGAVRRDLFASSEDVSSIFLDNPILLQTLAMDKLRGAAGLVRHEGWNWVDCLLESDDIALRGYGHEQQDEREPTAEEAHTIEQLAAEQRQHAEAYDKHQEEGDPDADDYELIEQQLCEALDVAEESLAAAHSALRQWSPEQMARAGALVRLDHRGVIVVDRGLVRPEDRKVRRDGSGDGSDAGGQAQAADEVPTSARPEFSEKLMRDLTAHRTAAIQAALMQNPRVALVTLVHRMAETVFSLYGRGNDVVKVHVHVTGDSTLAQDASDYANSPAAALLGEAETQWGDRLPGSPEALFRWLLAQPDTMLMELLAYCTARSVNAIASRERGIDHTDALAGALGVCMSDWWKPTAASYFGRVSRAQALEAIREATGSDESIALRKLKKGELAAYCAHLFEQVRWVPQPLRARGAPETALDMEQVAD